MEFDILALFLLPVFFALGWFAARIDMQLVLKQAMTVPSGFLKALDALVSDKTDVASNALAESVRQHPGAYELQGILGRLYRKRGENDLAIGLHKHMLDSNELPKKWQDAVRYELAQDFRKAGLVDRAESILLQLLNGNMALAARKDLLEIYQQDRDWQKAITTAGELSSDTHGYSNEIAQFHCELAQSALFKVDYVTAREHIDMALVINRKCVRATLLAGDVEFSQENYVKAIEIWQGIEKQNFEYLSMVGERLLDAYEKLGKPQEGIALIRGYAKSYSQVDLTDVLYQKVVVYEGEESALEEVRDSVFGHPTLQGIYRLLCARSINAHLSEKRRDVELARNVLSKQVQRVILHHCRCCHFRSRTFFWLCPACGAWECMTPNRSEM